jgi:excisionase family DNA binding protein
MSPFAKGLASKIFIAGCVGEPSTDHAARAEYALAAAQAFEHALEQLRSPPAERPTAPRTPPLASDWIEDAIGQLRPLATVKEVASVLRTSDRNARRMLADGRLQPVRSRAGGSSRVLIARTEVGRYLRSRVST